jgi:hypothetical protein
LSTKFFETFCQPKAGICPTPVTLSENVSEKLQIKDWLGFAKDFTAVETVSTGITETVSVIAPLL